MVVCDFVPLAGQIGRLKRRVQKQRVELQARREEERERRGREENGGIEGGRGGRLETADKEETLRTVWHSL